jgi:hypothetical protein
MTVLNTRLYSTNVDKHDIFFSFFFIKYVFVCVKMFEIMFTLKFEIYET